MFQKATLTTIALVCFLSSFAQVKITQTTHNGETYNVYPVRLPFNSSPYHLDYGYHSYMMYDGPSYGSYPREMNKKIMKKGQWEKEAFELFLPYNPFELADGKYLAYYQKRILKLDEYMQPVYSHEDTTLVAVTFIIKDNKKNGACTWYDYGKDRNILQECQYKKGEKVESWTLYRDGEKHSYSYKDGELHGNYTVTQDGKIKSTRTYVNGSLNGEYLTYFDKSDQVKIHLVYEFGKVVERKEFNSKGELEYWYNRNTKDDIYRKKYNKGVVIEENFWVDTTGVGKTITYYDNGTKRREYLKFYPEVYRKYNEPSDKNGGYSYYYRYPLNAIMSATSTVTGIGKCLKMDEYNPDGTVALSFDLRKDSMLNPVTRINEDGKKVAVYQLDTSTYQIGLYVKEYNPKTGLLSNEHLMRGGYSRDMNKDYDKDGNLLRFSYELDYLEQLYRDSVGFVQTSYYKTKKGTSSVYELLYASSGSYGYGYQSSWRATTYKGRVYSTFTSKNYVEDSIPWSEMQYSVFDKKGDFEVRHTKKFITPKIRTENGHYLSPVYSYYRSLSVSKQGIRDEADSLDFRLFYNGEPLNGTAMVKGKFRDPEHSYKVKFKKGKSRRSRETVIKVKDYDNFGRNRSLNTISGYVTKMGSYNARYSYFSPGVSYSNNKKEGEVDGNSYGLPQQVVLLC